MGALFFSPVCTSYRNMRRSYNAKASVKRHSIIRDAYGFEVRVIFQNLCRKQTMPLRCPRIWRAYTRSTLQLGSLKKSAALISGYNSSKTSVHQSTNKRVRKAHSQPLFFICRAVDVIFAGFWDDVLEASLKRVVKEQKTRPGDNDLGDRLDSLVRMGIPSFLRSYAWGLFLGYDSEKTPGLFKLLSSQTQSTSPSTLRPSRTVDDDTCGHRHLLRRYSSVDSKELESLDENDTYQDESLFHWSGHRIRNAHLSMYACVSAVSRPLSKSTKI